MRKTKRLLMLEIIAVAISCSPCIAAPGIISTVAGNGTPGYGGDGGSSTAAQINWPAGVAVDGDKNLYLADVNNHRIRRVDAFSGVITTVVGTGISGFDGDGGPATAAKISGPSDVFIVAGDIYFTDYANHRIRKIEESTGIITTVAGTGVPGFSGDGGPAVLARLYYPAGLYADSSENIYFCDEYNHRVRKINGLTGVITTVAGTGTPGFSGDGGIATLAEIRSPTGIALDVAGNLFIALQHDHRIRRVDGLTGLISTVAGDGTPGFAGDGGTAILSQLNRPARVYFDAENNLYFTDLVNNRIRKIDGASGIISTVAGGGMGGDGGQAIHASLLGPFGLAVDDENNFYLSEYSGHKIRKVEGVPPPEPIPTLSEWAMIVLCGGLIWFGYSRLTRNKTPLRSRNWV